ncbi:MAG: tRNA (cytidine(34)-2'-O)-methyltransferase [Azospirillaceae bacterium]
MQTDGSSQPSGPAGKIPGAADAGPRLVLFEPDIPQNAGAMMRLAACLDIGVDIVEPCGFVLDDRRLQRAGMDYLATLDRRRWPSWRAYAGAAHPGRLIVLTTRGDTPLHDIAFRPADRLLVGRESAGVPDAVHAAADLRAVIPLRAGARSLNVATAAAIALGELRRQIPLQVGEAAAGAPMSATEAEAEAEAEAARTTAGRPNG